MSNGFFGRILWVDLNEETFKEQNYTEELYRQYLGGYGLGVKLIYESMPKNTDPLEPESVFGFFPGLLTGSVAPLTGRWMVGGKSPLTGTWGDANGGGFFGAEIKKCGYDGILIKGAFKSPKYIAITEGNNQIFDASELWGLDISKTEDWLKGKHPNVRIAAIGPSGEKLSLISSIVHDKFRVAARSGFGAVMGSKKLKALVLKGNQKVTIADAENLRSDLRKYNDGVKNDKVGAMFLYNKYGLACLNESAGVSGDAPIKNWGGYHTRDFPIEKIKNISGDVINKYKTRNYGCFSCSVQCGAVMKVPEAGLEETHIPEYETCAAFGHLLLNDDVVSLFTLNEMCNRAGIDTISVGGVVAFAIECYENGLITNEDTSGIELSWGDSNAIIELTKLIINREGIGDLFADGLRVAPEKIGKESHKYAIHSLGQPIPMHDPKFFNTLGRTYAFDPTPGRHTASSLDHFITGVMRGNKYVKEFIIPRKWRRTGEPRFEAMKMCTGLHQSICSLGMCSFTYWFQTYPLLECIKSVVGWDLSIDEVIEIGLRIQTLRQAFTLREGVEISKNELHGRIVGDPPFEDGPNRGKSVDYKADYRGYCEKMGWNPENGYPLEETLKKLNLEFVISDLY